MLSDQEWRARRNIRRNALENFILAVIGGVFIWCLWTWVSWPGWIEAILIFVLAIFTASFVIVAVIAGLQSMGVGRKG